MSEVTEGKIESNQTVIQKEVEVTNVKCSHGSIEQVTTVE